MATAAVKPRPFGVVLKSTNRCTSSKYQNEFAKRHQKD